MPPRRVRKGRANVEAEARTGTLPQPRHRVQGRTDGLRQVAHNPVCTGPKRSRRNFRERSCESIPSESHVPQPPPRLPSLRPCIDHRSVPPDARTPKHVHTTLEQAG